MESVNEFLRVAQAQQQQECFPPPSEINYTVYAAFSEVNCSITAASPDLTL